MIRSLLWKECREQVWKAAILLIAALSCIGAGYLLNLHSQFGPFRDSEIQWESTCVLILLVIAPIWIASGFTAAERRAGSFDVLLALPVRPSIIFAIKALAGLLAYMLPILLTLAIQHSIHHTPLDNTSSFVAPLLLSAPVYFLMLTGAASSRSESRAAMIGVLLLLACMIWAFIALLAADRNTPPPYWLFPNPFMLFACNPAAPTDIQHIPFQMLILLFWVAASLFRFLRVASNTGTGTEEQQLPLTPTLLAPLPHPPLLWKEIREQFSVLAIAFWAALGVAIIGALVEIEESIRYGSNTHFLDIYGLMLQIMLIAGTVAPLLISIVLGVGAVAGDLDQRLYHFWRAQPIPTRRWFWTKYLVSAVGILLLVIVPLSIAAGGSALFDLDGPSAGDNTATHFRTQAWTAFTAVIVILPFAHALSILLASIIRRTMYATIATVLLLAAITTLPIFGRLNLVQVLTDPDQPGQALLSLFCASLILSTLLLVSAQTALQREWRLA